MPSAPWRISPAEGDIALISAMIRTPGSRSDAAENAAQLVRLLEGEPGPRREAVLLNVSAALVVEGRAADIPDGYELASWALDHGSARESLERLRAASWTAPALSQPSA